MRLPITCKVRVCAVAISSWTSKVGEKLGRSEDTGWLATCECVRRVLNDASGRKLLSDGADAIKLSERPVQLALHDAI